MSHIRDAELAVVRAIQCGTNGAYCFLVSETDPTPIRSVKEAKDHLDKLILEQQIKQLKAEIASMEAMTALKAVAEKVAHFAMEA